MKALCVAVTSGYLHAEDVLSVAAVCKDTCEKAKVDALWQDMILRDLGKPAADRAQRKSRRPRAPPRFQSWWARAYLDEVEARMEEDAGVFQGLC